MMDKEQQLMSSLENKIREGVATLIENTLLTSELKHDKYGNYNFQLFEYQPLHWLITDGTLNRATMLWGDWRTNQLYHKK